MSLDINIPSKRPIIHHPVIAAAVCTVASILGGGVVHLGNVSRDSKATMAAMPDPKLTPGKVNPDASKDDCCTPGYSTTVRHVTESMKREVFRRYGIRNPKPGQYEIDHLVPLELCGLNDLENLWPQPYFGALNAHHKDVLENKLHKLVCDGHISMETAQHKIRTDWPAAYEEYVSN